jgi:hypothetical protein
MERTNIRFYHFLYAVKYLTFFLLKLDKLITKGNSEKNDFRE